MTEPPPIEPQFRNLLELARNHAAREPTPAEPADEIWEKEADQQLYRLILQNADEEPSPEAACALIPRLEVALCLWPEVWRRFDATLKIAAENDVRGLQEWLLIDRWRAGWKIRWLCREFERSCAQRRQRLVAQR
jgi:hypothetical protein